MTKGNTFVYTFKVINMSNSRGRCRYYKECRELIEPEDPEASSGKLRSLCDTCYAFRVPSSEQERLDKLEQGGIEILYIYEHSNISKQQWDRMEQTIRRQDYLEKKFNEHIIPKRKPKVSVNTLSSIYEKEVNK